MPELPEVESVRRSLLPKICNKKIVSIAIQTPRIVRNGSDFFVSKVTGKIFVGIERIGKLLMFELSNGEYILAHLKMTGKFIYTECCSITNVGK